MLWRRGHIYSHVTQPDHERIRSRRIDGIGIVAVPGGWIVEQAYPPGAGRTQCPVRSRARAPRFPRRGRASDRKVRCTTSILGASELRSIDGWSRRDVDTARYRHQALSGVPTHPRRNRRSARNAFPTGARATHSHTDHTRDQPIAHDIVGRAVPAKQLPRTTVDGQFSVYFQVAATLQYGNLGWSVYDHLANPDVDALIERIEVVSNPDVQPAGAILTIGEAAVRVDAPSGEPDGGIDHSVVAGKFQSITSTVWDSDRQSRILSAVTGMPNSTDVSEVIRLLRA